VFEGRKYTQGQGQKHENQGQGLGEMSLMIVEVKDIKTVPGSFTFMIYEF